MFLLAVIAESFAVIGEQHDGRAIVDSRSAKALEQPADDLVRVGDLAVVRRVGRITRWRRVGLVRLVEVEEQEERRFRMASSHLSAAASVARRRAGPVRSTAPGRRRQLAVVGVEPLVDPGRPAKHVGRHEAAGRPAQLVQRALQDHCPVLTVNPTLSRTPCSNGSCPERMLVWAGSVCGACEYACSNTTDSAASESMFGVRTLR